MTKRVKRNRRRRNRRIRVAFNPHGPWQQRDTISQRVEAKCELGSFCYFGPVLQVWRTWPTSCVRFAGLNGTSAEGGRRSTLPYRVTVAHCHCQRSNSGPLLRKISFFFHFPDAFAVAFSTRYVPSRCYSFGYCCSWEITSGFP